MSKSYRKKSLIVFTDGSCSNNGSMNAVGGIGIHFPNGELKDLSKIFHHERCTNQRTELYAILTALRYIRQNMDMKKYRVHIKTDSQYSIDCVTRWVYGWIKNGWKTKNNVPVSNREFIEMIHKYYEIYDIVFEHVEGHSKGKDKDSIGNTEADKLATMATKRALSQKNSYKKENYINKHEDRKNHRNDNVIDITIHETYEKSDYPHDKIDRPYVPYINSKRNAKNKRTYHEPENIIVELVKAK